MKKKTTKAAPKRGVVSAIGCSASVLAKRIAAEILTVGASGGDVRCTRAVMMRGKYPDGERDMGGRNMASIAFVVERHLVAAGYPPNPTGQTVPHETARKD